MVIMKKLIIISAVILAFVLAGCHYPGLQNGADLDPDDAMATEIVKILTGTPAQVEPTATLSEETVELTEIPDETPIEPDEDLIEPVEPIEPEEPATSPAPTSTPMPSPTATLADSDPTRNLGDPDWVDNMDNGDNWPTGLDKYTAIKFENGYMKLTASTGIDGWRVTWPTLGNFYLEAALQSPGCEGNDSFGLLFRVPADSRAGKGYLFGITCDGRYSLRRWDGIAMYSLIGLTEHAALNKGVDAVNKLGVMARDADLVLYINGHKVHEISDANYLTGKFGIFVGGINVDDLTVWVDQIRYWNNP